MKSEYEKLLERAHSQLPPEILKHKRFEIPQVRCATIGMRTIFINYREVAEALNRDAKHLLRYLSKEMATAGSIVRTRAIFQGKFRNDTLNRLIQRYAREFVVCPVCKRPDTNIVKEKRFTFMVCEACGAKSSVRSV